MKRLLSAFLLTLSLATQAGLPPTSSKISGESVYSTTFKTDFGTFKGTRSGTTLTLNSIGAGVGDSLALGGTKAASAILDVQSTTQGVLPPRMTTAQMLAIASPANGLTIYNTDVSSLASYSTASSQWTYGFGNLNATTPRVAYSPGSNGFGSPTISAYWSREGEYLVMDGGFTTGSSTSSPARINLPSGLTVSSKMTTAILVGNAGRNTTVNNDFDTIAAPGTNYIGIGGGSNFDCTICVVNANTIAASGDFVRFSARVPIEGWSGNTSAWVQANSNPIATTTEFSAFISTALVVGQENVDWINGNCVGNPAVCTLNGNLLDGTNPITQPLNCVATSGVQLAPQYFGITSSASSITIRQDANATTGFYVKCSKAASDYLAAHSPFIIGTFEAIGNIATLSEVQPSGTDAGSSSVGTVARVLNTKVDPNGIVTSLVSNQFTLPAGRYYIDASAPVLGAVQHKIRIRNITDSITAIYGTSSFAASTNLTESKALLSGEVTITAPKTFELQHYIATGRAVSGLGTATFSGDVEVYSIVKIQRLR